MFNRKFLPLAILLIYVPSVLLASTIMYKWVEKPAMDYGRRLSNWKWLLHLNPPAPPVIGEAQPPLSQKKAVGI